MEHVYKKHTECALTTPRVVLLTISSSKKAVSGSAKPVQFSFFAFSGQKVAGLLNLS